MSNIKTRVTKLNQHATGPGLDLMDFDNVTFWKDYLIPGTSVRNGNSAPDMVNLRNGLYLPAFDGSTTMEQAFFAVHILHDFKAGTYPTFHVHWTHNNASPSGNVKWNVEYSYAHGYGAGTYGASTTLSVVQAAGAQYTHHITDDDEMSVVADMEPDGQLICRIYRDPTDVQDTFGTDAFLIGVDLHYAVGQFATYERNRPFTSAGFSE